MVEFSPFDTFQSIKEMWDNTDMLQRESMNGKNELNLSWPIEIFPATTITYGCSNEEWEVGPFFDPILYF